MTARRVDIEPSTIIFESREKGLRGVDRAVPVRTLMIDALDRVHGLRERQKGRAG